MLEHLGDTSNIEKKHHLLAQNSCQLFLIRRTLVEHQSAFKKPNERSAIELELLSGIFDVAPRCLIWLLSREWAFSHKTHTHRAL